MKLSRNKIDKLLKITNQSRKNKRDIKRSKSLHNARANVLSDDDLILVDKAVKGKTMHQKTKPYNLRFKTLKNNKKTQKQGGAADITIKVVTSQWKDDTDNNDKEEKEASGHIVLDVVIPLDATVEQLKTKLKETTGAMVGKTGADSAEPYYFIDDTTHKLVFNGIDLLGFSGENDPTSGKQVDYSEKHLNDLNIINGSKLTIVEIKFTIKVQDELGKDIEATDCIPETKISDLVAKIITSPRSLITDKAHIFAQNFIQEESIENVPYYLTYIDTAKNNQYTIIDYTADNDKTLKLLKMNGNTKFFIRSGIYLFFHRILYGDLFYLIDNLYVRHLFTYLLTNEEFKDITTMEELSVTPDLEFENVEKAWLEVPPEMEGIGAKPVDSASAKAGEIRVKTVNKKEIKEKLELGKEKKMLTGGAGPGGAGTGEYTYYIDTTNVQTPYDAVGFPNPAIKPHEESRTKYLNNIKFFLQALLKNDVAEDPDEDFNPAAAVEDDADLTYDIFVFEDTVKVDVESEITAAIKKMEEDEKEAIEKIESDMRGAKDRAKLDAELKAAKGDDKKVIILENKVHENIEAINEAFEVAEASLLVINQAKDDVGAAAGTAAELKILKGTNDKLYEIKKKELETLEKNIQENTAAIKANGEQIKTLLTTIDKSDSLKVTLTGELATLDSDHLNGIDKYQLFKTKYNDILAWYKGRQDSTVTEDIFFKKLDAEVFKSALEELKEETDKLPELIATKEKEEAEAAAKEKEKGKIAKGEERERQIAERKRKAEEAERERERKRVAAEAEEERKRKAAEEEKERKRVAPPPTASTAPTITAAPAIAAPPGVNPLKIDENDLTDLKSTDMNTSVNKLKELLENNITVIEEVPNDFRIIILEINEYISDKYKSDKNIVDSFIESKDSASNEAFKRYRENIEQIKLYKGLINTSLNISEFLNLLNQKININGLNIDDAFLVNPENSKFIKDFEVDKSKKEIETKLLTIKDKSDNYTGPRKTLQQLQAASYNIDGGGPALSDKGKAYQIFLDLVKDDSSKPAQLEKSFIEMIKKFPGEIKPGEEKTGSILDISRSGKKKYIGINKYVNTFYDRMRDKYFKILTSPPTQTFKAKVEIKNKYQVHGKNIEPSIDGSKSSDAPNLSKYLYIFQQFEKKNNSQEYYKAIKVLLGGIFKKEGEYKKKEKEIMDIDLGEESKKDIDFTLDPAKAIERYTGSLRRAKEEKEEAKSSRNMAQIERADKKIKKYNLLIELFRAKSNLKLRESEPGKTDENVIKGDKTADFVEYKAAATLINKLVLQDIHVKDPLKDLTSILQIKYYLNFLLYFFFEPENSSEVAEMLEAKNIVKKVNQYYQTISADDWSLSQKKGKSSPNSKYDIISYSANYLKEYKANANHLIDNFTENNNKLYASGAGERNSALFYLHYQIEKNSPLKQFVRQIEETMSMLRCKTVKKFTSGIGFTFVNEPFKDTKQSYKNYLDMQRNWVKYKNQGLSKVFITMPNNFDAPESEQVLFAFLNYHNNETYLQYITSIFSNTILPLAKKYKEAIINDMKRIRNIDLQSSFISQLALNSAEIKGAEEDIKKVKDSIQAANDVVKLLGAANPDDKFTDMKEKIDKIIDKNIKELQTKYVKNIDINLLVENVIRDYADPANPLPGKGEEYFGKAIKSTGMDASTAKTEIEKFTHSVTESDPGGSADILQAALEKNLNTLKNTVSDKEKSEKNLKDSINSGNEVDKLASQILELVNSDKAGGTGTAGAAGTGTGTAGTAGTGTGTGVRRNKIVKHHRKKLKGGMYSADIQKNANKLISLLQEIKGKNADNFDLKIPLDKVYKSAQNVLNDTKDPAYNKNPTAYEKAQADATVLKTASEYLTSLLDTNKGSQKDALKAALDAALAKAAEALKSGVSKAAALLPNAPGASSGDLAALRADVQNLKAKLLEQEAKKLEDENSAAINAVMGVDDPLGKEFHFRVKIPKPQLFTIEGPGGNDTETQIKKLGIDAMKNNLEVLEDKIKDLYKINFEEIDAMIKKAEEVFKECEKFETSPKAEADKAFLIQRNKELKTLIDKIKKDSEKLNTTVADLEKKEEKIKAGTGTGAGTGAGAGAGAGTTVVSGGGMVGGALEAPKYNDDGSKTLTYDPIKTDNTFDIKNKQSGATYLIPTDKKTPGVTVDKPGTITIDGTQKPTTVTIQVNKNTAGGIEKNKVTLTLKSSAGGTPPASESSASKTAVSKASESEASAPAKPPVSPSTYTPITASSTWNDTNSFEYDPDSKVQQIIKKDAGIAGTDFKLSYDDASKTKVEIADKAKPISIDATSGTITIDLSDPANKEIKPEYDIKDSSGGNKKISFKAKVSGATSPIVTPTPAVLEWDSDKKTQEIKYDNSTADVVINIKSGGKSALTDLAIFNDTDPAEFKDTNIISIDKITNTITLKKEAKIPEIINVNSTSKGSITTINFINTATAAKPPSPPPSAKEWNPATPTAEETIDYDPKAETTITVKASANTYSDFKVFDEAGTVELPTTGPVTIDVTGIIKIAVVPAAAATPASTPAVPAVPGKITIKYKTAGAGADTEKKITLKATGTSVTADPLTVTNPLTAIDPLTGANPLTGADTTGSADAKAAGVDASNAQKTVNKFDDIGKRYLGKALEYAQGVYDRAESLAPAAGAGTGAGAGAGPGAAAKGGSNKKYTKKHLHERKRKTRYRHMIGGASVAELTKVHEELIRLQSEKNGVVGQESPSIVPGAEPGAVPGAEPGLGPGSSSQEESATVTVPGSSSQESATVPEPGSSSQESATVPAGNQPLAPPVVENPTPVGEDPAGEEKTGPAGEEKTTGPVEKEETAPAGKEKTGPAGEEETAATVGEDPAGKEKTGPAGEEETAATVENPPKDPASKADEGGSSRKKKTRRHKHSRRNRSGRKHSRRKHSRHIRK